MKYILLFLILQSTIHGQAQSFNKREGDSKNVQLIGKINQEALSLPPFASWFIENKQNYQPNPQILKELNTVLNDYTLTVFMGSWCGDSKRLVPRLYKILEATNFDLDRLTMIAVARDRAHYKQSPGGEHEGQLIHRVPTIIISQQGLEKGRIVESVKESLEEDILQITKGDYTPNHHLVTVVDQLLATTNTTAFERRVKKYAKKLQPLTQSPYQLNTYANVLYYALNKEKALAVLYLNTYLYPNNTTTLYNYGYRLMETGQFKKATIYFKKVLKITPSHKKALDALSQIESKLEA